MQATAAGALRLLSARCPVCRTIVGEQPVSCARCEVTHHPECWDYAGGCAIFACRPSPEPLPDLPAPWVRIPAPPTGWQDPLHLLILAFLAGSTLPRLLAFFLA